MQVARFAVFTLLIASGSVGCTFGTLPRNEHPISRHVTERDDARGTPVSFEWAFDTLGSVRR
jgi:hypothetical protein